MPGRGRRARPAEIAAWHRCRPLRHRWRTRSCRLSSPWPSAASGRPPGGHFDGRPDHHRILCLRAARPRLGGTDRRLAIRRSRRRARTRGAMGSATAAPRVRPGRLAVRLPDRGPATAAALSDGRQGVPPFFDLRTDSFEAYTAKLDLKSHPPRFQGTKAPAMKQASSGSWLIRATARCSTRS